MKVKTGMRAGSYTCYPPAGSNEHIRYGVNTRMARSLEENAGYTCVKD